MYSKVLYAGAFDSLNESVQRSQYFVSDVSERPFFESVIKFGKDYQANLEKGQEDLFGGTSEVQLPELEIPYSEAWSSVHRLNKEKEVLRFTFQVTHWMIFALKSNLL